MSFPIFQMLKKPKYLGLSFLLSILMFFFYPVLQVLGQGLNNYWFWFSLLTPLRWFLYLLYVILFGITFSFFFYQRSQKVCAVKKTIGGGFFGLIGSFLATTTSICSACLSWLVLLLPFLPTTFSLFLGKYSIEIMILSIALLVLALWLLGGFQKLKKR